MLTVIRAIFTCLDQTRGALRGVTDIHADVRARSISWDLAPAITPAATLLLYGPPYPHPVSDRRRPKAEAEVATGQSLFFGAGLETRHSSVKAARAAELPAKKQQNHNAPIAAHRHLPLRTE